MSVIFEHFFFGYKSIIRGLVTHHSRQTSCSGQINFKLQHEIFRHCKYYGSNQRLMWTLEQKVNWSN
jgi:hypothetical protein